MKIIFLNYGEFGNNSSSHIETFAAGLGGRGHEVVVLADGALERGRPGLQVFPTSVLESPGTAGLQGFLDDPATLVHVWTPRERVRRLVEPLAARGLRYVVHLEDEEDVVTASQLRMPSARLAALGTNALDLLIPAHLSHPVRSREFLRGAAGITAIVAPLLKFAPSSTPTLVLEPGADLETFRQVLTPEERHDRRAALGFSSDAAVLMYHGGVHPAIQREIFSLYAAVGIMHRARRSVVLLRCGTADDTREVGTAFRRASGVIRLGYLPRETLPAALDLADIYVQPGWPNPFNAHRLPSKLLDFFSMGRPVILPKTNLGERLSGEEAVVLQQGGAAEIIRCVERLLADPSLGERIGAAGRSWVEKHFRWEDKVRQLEAFYFSL